MKFSFLLNTLFLFGFFFSGCAFFTPPKQHPVKHDWAGPWLRKKATHVFSMTPERRTVIVMPKHPEEKVKFCAEPPPDVAENLVSTLRFLAEASAKNPEFKASADLYKAISATPSSLFIRSQGVQLLRDGLYNLCQACINGAINQGEYSKKYTELLKASLELIKLEIPELNKRVVSDAINKAIKAADESKEASMKAINAATEAQKSADDVKKLLKKTKDK